MLYRQDLDPEVADRVLHSTWETSATVHVFNDSGWLTDRVFPEMLEAHMQSGFTYQLADLKRLSAYDVTKICFVGDHDDLCRLHIQLNEALGERAHLCFSAEYCRVLPLGCNKGAALAVLSSSLGYTLQDCMAFGDAMNDREMLESVGYGMIMGNAMPQLRAALPHLPVIGHCRDQAVSHFLTHWLDTPHLPLFPPNDDDISSKPGHCYPAFFYATGPDGRFPRSGRNIAHVRRHPLRVVIGIEVAVAAVAQQCHDSAATPFGTHPHGKL